MKTFDKNAGINNVVAKNALFEKALGKAIFDPSAISDNELFSLCQQYGNNAKMWKRKFEELLPEVMKRELYKKRRFVTIYEFAAKVSGLSYDSVDKVLRVYKQLEDKPILRSLVVEFGWSKLQIVSGIATVDTDASWAEKVRVLPKSSLETFVRDLRRQEEKARIEAGIAGKCTPMVGTQVIGGTSGGVGVAVPGTSTGTGELTDQQRLSDNKNLNCKFSPGGELPSGQYSGQINMRTGEIGPKGIDAASGGMAGSDTAVGADNIGSNEIDSQTGRPIFGSAENDWPTMSFRIDPETEFRLRKLKIQIEKERKIRLSFNQFFKIMIERAEVIHGSGKRQIDAQKERLAEKPGGGAEKKISVDSGGRGKTMTEENKNGRAIGVATVTTIVVAATAQKVAAAQRPATRYIPMQIKRELEQKYHGHCGFPGCKKSFDVYHHVRRFALNKAHSLASIVPLCKEHHDVVHGGWVGNEQDSLVRPFDWKLEHEEKWFLPSREIDEIWKGCRKVGGLMRSEEGAVKSVD